LVIGCLQDCKRPIQAPTSHITSLSLLPKPTSTASRGGQWERTDKTLLKSEVERALSNPSHSTWRRLIIWYTNLSMLSPAGRLKPPCPKRDPARGLLQGGHRSARRPRRRQGLCGDDTRGHHDRQTRKPAAKPATTSPTSNGPQLYIKVLHRGRHRPVKRTYLIDPPIRD
jgi:hypothetical protein